MSFHPNGQQLAAVGFCSTLSIINTSSGETTQQLECSSADVRTVAFSRDGQRMAVAGRDGKIRLWNVTTGARERDIPSCKQRVRALAFSPDGTRLAAAGDEIMIHVIDLSGGGQDVTLTARPAKVFAAVFLNDQTLATAGSDNRICIWDLPSAPITKELVGHTGIGGFAGLRQRGHDAGVGRIRHDAKGLEFDRGRLAAIGAAGEDAGGCDSVVGRQFSRCGLESAVQPHLETFAWRQLVGILSSLGVLNFGKRRARRAKKQIVSNTLAPRRGRRFSVESLEERRLMAGDVAPQVLLGSVYFEEATGDDSRPDVIQVTFEGGAAGTTLTSS